MDATFNRPINFRNVAPGHWVNTETGVELRISEIDGWRWTVTVPVLTTENRRYVVLKDNLIAARRYAKAVAVPQMRRAMSDAWLEATTAY